MNLVNRSSQLLVGNDFTTFNLLQRISNYAFRTPFVDAIGFEPMFVTIVMGVTSPIAQFRWSLPRGVLTRIQI